MTDSPLRPFQMHTQDRHRWNTQAWESVAQLCASLFCSILCRDSFSLEPSAMYKHGQEGSSWRHYGTLASVPIVSASWSSVCSSWSSHASPAFLSTVSDAHNNYTQTHPRHTYTVTMPKHPRHTHLFASHGCCPQVGTFSSTSCFLLWPDQTEMQAKWGRETRGSNTWLLVSFLCSIIGSPFVLWVPFSGLSFTVTITARAKVSLEVFLAQVCAFGTGPKAFLHPILTVLSFCKEAVQQEELKRKLLFQPVSIMPCFAVFHFVLLLDYAWLGESNVSSPLECPTSGFLKNCIH